MIDSTDKKKTSRLVGKKVYIKDGFYSGHWGYIQSWDGHSYHVAGGSIGEVAPIFSRSEFIIKRR